MKLKDSDIIDHQLCEGENIKIYVDKYKNIFISAPAMNHTKLKVGDFIVTGNEVEIKAGRNVCLTTSHPNVLTIGVDIDVEKAIIARLEKRIENLERMVAKLIKGQSI